jgi:hypothetical protein
MAQANPTITIKVAWWVGPLGRILVAFHRLTGWKPKDDGEWLVQFIGRHGLKVVR